MRSANSIISTNLKSIRQERSMTLDALAEITGVSKSMLSDIERCAKSPTICVLEKICAGINVPLSRLTYEKPADILLVTNDKVTPYSAWEGFDLFTLFEFDANNKFEIFRQIVQPHAERSAERHEAGVREYIICTKGVLSIQINKDVYTIHEGEAIQFIANTSHRYFNPTDEICGFIMLLYHE